MRIFLLAVIARVVLAIPQGQLTFNVGGISSSELRHDGIVSSWWDPPCSVETAQWVFQSVSGHMRHWPNILYRNGHSIVPGTIEPGTLMYHGRPRSASPPPGPEWLSFDPEHSYMFGRSLYTYMVGDHPLKILYFDGSSASNMRTGTIDTQEILLHGEIREDGWKDEFNRIKELCDWGKEFGIKGFIRMEFDYEVMLCDFDDGLHLVSSLDLLPANTENWGPPSKSISESVSANHLERSTGEQSHPRNLLVRASVENDQNDDDKSHIPWKEPAPPKGWKGSLRHIVSLDFEAIQAGNWHNKAPGVHGVTLDYSGFMTFFDPKYASLVKARAGVEGKRWRVGNITKEDVNLFNEELREILTRTRTGSGVKWEAVVRSVVDRHAGRLEFLSDWLGDKNNNSTYIIKHARKAILTMISPHFSVKSIPQDFKTNKTWLDPVIHHCSTTSTARLPVDRFTPQEYLLKRSVDTVMREICRTVGLLWIDAFDAEALGDEHEQQGLLAKWKTEVDRLMDWLGWAEWVKCKPACSSYEMCSLPQWPFNMRWPDSAPEFSYTPTCMSRIEQDLGGPKRTL